MPRPEKVQAVADIKQKLESSNAVFLTEYAGLSVKQQQALRRALRASEGEYKVVKMTLAKLAVKELGLDEVESLLVGPTALAFANGDAVSIAKALDEFASDNESLVIKGGLMGDEFLTPEKVSALAKIESREVLLAKLAGAMKAPMTEMAGLAAALLRGSATMFQQLLEKKEADAPAPEPEAAAAAPEPAAAEEPAVEDGADVTATEDATEPTPEAADADAGEAAEAGGEETAEVVEADEPAAAEADEPVAGEETVAAEADETTDAAAEETTEAVAEETPQEEAEADAPEAEDDDPAEAEEEK